CYSITSSTQISTLSLHDALPISLHAGIGPFQGLLRRRREHGVQTHGVGAVLVDGFLRVDTVVFRLRHFAHAGSLQRQTIAAAFGAGYTAFFVALNSDFGGVNPLFSAVFGALVEGFGQPHALTEQVVERLVARHQAGIAQQLVEEARVQQVQNGVFNTADVLVDRQPVVGFFRVDYVHIVLRRAVTGVIPGRLHYGVEGVGFAECRLAVVFDVLKFRVVFDR